MRPSSLGPRPVVDVVVRFVPAAAVAGVGLLGLHAAGGLPGSPGLLVPIALALATLCAAAAAWAVARRRARQLEELRLGTELMATVNPAFRLAPTGETALLAREINRLADRLAESRSGLEREVARATGELLVERAKLTAVLEGLGEGVVVAAEDGRITLANRGADRLLGPAGGTLLGRSLFDLVDRDKVEQFLGRLRQPASAPQRFTLHPGGGAVLEAVMTPFFDGGGRMIGFVLVLHDVTRPARLDEERVRRLAQAVHEAREGLASIRSLSESLLGDPGLGPGSGRRLLEAIHGEAVRLSALVRQLTEPGGLGLIRLPWHFESIALAELTGLALRRVGPAAAIEVDALPAAPRLRAEASALSEALAHLLRAALAGVGPGGRIWLRPSRVGGVLQLDAGAEGGTPIGELEAWLDAALTVRGGERATARDVIQQHGGEVWGYRDGDRFGFRLLLPAAEGPDGPGPPGPGLQAALTGAGLRSGAGAAAADPRPDFYDFSLFQEMERHVALEALERRLDELPCVVFDLETTGLHPEAGDRIVSIAGVRVRGGAVRRGEVFDALVNPRRPIAPASSRFHGITEAMVAAAPPADVVLPAFLRFARDAVLVGHQVWFDVKFLAVEGARLGLPPLTMAHPVLDTRALSELVHAELGDHGLEAVAGRLGVVIQARHSALGDALATADIFVRLVALLRARGITTLGQALEASRQRERARAEHQATGGSP